jgi:hypothetical protein
MLTVDDARRRSSIFVSTYPPFGQARGAPKPGAPAELEAGRPGSRS